MRVDMDDTKSLFLTRTGRRPTVSTPVIVSLPLMWYLFTNLTKSQTLRSGGKTLDVIIRRMLHSESNNNGSRKRGPMSKAKDAVLHLPDLLSKPCLRIFIGSLLKQFDTAEPDEQLFVPDERPELSLPMAGGLSVRSGHRSDPPSIQNETPP